MIEERKKNDLTETIEGREEKGLTKGKDTREAIEEKDLTEVIVGREEKDLTEAIVEKGEKDTREVIEGKGVTDGVTDGVTVERKEMRMKVVGVETGIKSPGGLVGEGDGGCLMKGRRDEWVDQIVIDRKGLDEEGEGADQVSASLH